MSKVQFEFPDKAKVVSLLACVYEDPRVALAEFIVNGMDAGAHTIRISPVTGKVNSVVVLDDGYGMSQAEMERIVANLANSIKTSPEELQKRHIDPARVIGKMGIGILGFQSFARKVVFISKTDDSGPVWRMAMERGQVAADIEPALGKDKERIASVSRGTAVELIDISRDTMRLFSPRALQQYLEKNFAALLRRDDCAAVFVGNQRVTPPPLEGTPFPMSRLPIGRFGEAEMSLSVVASGIGLGDGVALTSKGRTVVKEIIRLPEFQHAPWTDGVLHGSIEASFLTVAPTRSNYVRDESFGELVHALLLLEEPLTMEIQKAREKRSLEQQSDALQKLREAMGHALHDLELEGSHTQTRSVGGVIGMATAGGSAHAETGGASLPKGEPPNKSPEGGAARRPDHSQLNLEWRHLHSLVHSQLAEGGMVIVNEDCPDYAEECSSLSSQRTLRYLAKIAAKELARRNFAGADTDEVMEHAMELELRALRYIAPTRDKES